MTSRASVILTSFLLLGAVASAAVYVHYPSWVGAVYATAVSIVFQTMGYVLWRRELMKNPSPDTLSEGLTTLTVLITGGLLYMVAMGVAMYVSEGSRKGLALVKGALLGIVIFLLSTYLSLLTTKGVVSLQGA
jgi:hypothetical protein